LIDLIIFPQKYH